MVLLNLVIKPVWLVAEFVVQDKIGHEAYGLYAALFSLSFLFVNLADFGINQLAVRKLSSNEGDNQSFFQNSFGFKLLMCIVYPLLITSLGYLIGYREKELWYLLMLSFSQALFQTIYFFRSNFQAKQFFKTDALISVGDRVILLLCVLILFAFYKMDLDTFIFALLFTSIATFIISYFLLYTIYEKIKAKIQTEQLKGILKSSFPFAAIALLYALNERIDMVMLERLGGEMGEKFAGWYAGAYRWLDAFLMYLWTIMPLIYARLSRLRENVIEQVKFLEAGQILLFFPMLFISGIAFFYADPMFSIFKNSGVQDIEMMSKLLRVLIFHILFQGAFSILGVWLNANGYEKTVVKMVWVTLLVNVGMNYFLIPKYGPLAAAYSTLVSSFLISLFYIFKISRLRIMVISPLQIVKMIVVSLLYFFVLYASHLSGLHWVISSFVSGLILLLMIWLLYKRIFREVLK